jgi:hypothetical protein
MHHNNVTKLIHFHNHFIVSCSLYVSVVKRPSSGGTTLAVFGVSCVPRVAFDWLQVVGRLGVVSWLRYCDT